MLAFKTDPPGGQTLEIHRRCWIGHGGATPPGTVRLSGPQIGCDTDLEFIFPTGVGVFKTGGLSLQEMIVPVLTLKMGKEEPPASPGGEVRLLNAPDEIANRTFGIQLTLAGLFDDQPFTVRPLLLSKGVIVGKAGMALDADYDPEKGDVTLHPEKTAAVGMILENDDKAAMAPRSESPIPRDALDDKANRVFSDRVVRKNLMRKVKVGANVPVFVLEFLLGKYCASSDEMAIQMAIQMGLQVVNKTLAENYIGPDT